jgi:hypothetical protein
MRNRDRTPGRDARENCATDAKGSPKIFVEFFRAFRETFASFAAGNRSPLS